MSVASMLYTYTSIHSQLPTSPLFPYTTLFRSNHYRHPTAHGFQDGYLDLRGLADIKDIHLFHGLMVFLNQFHGMTVELYPFLRNLYRLRRTDEQLVAQVIFHPFNGCRKRRLADMYHLRCLCEAVVFDHSDEIFKLLDFHDHINSFITLVVQ